LAFYKRSVFLINPSFQLRFSLAVCLLVFLSSLVYPLMLWDFFKEVLANQPQLTDKIGAAKDDFLIFLIVIQVLFTGVIFVLFIFLTHKIAGPLFKLKQHLSNIRQGEPISPLSFRSGDHFMDVADEVSLFLESIAMNQESDFQYIDEVATYIENLSSVVPDDKKPVLKEISRRLLDIESRYK
jgi:methyl-accepting chemotaxis protein